MTALSKPSLLLHDIRVVRVGERMPFKFSEPLPLRIESLLERKKSDKPLSRLDQAPEVIWRDTLKNFAFGY